MDDSVIGEDQDPDTVPIEVYSIVHISAEYATLIKFIVSKGRFVYQSYDNTQQMPSKTEQSSKLRSELYSQYILLKKNQSSKEQICECYSELQQNVVVHDWQTMKVSVFQCQEWQYCTASSIRLIERVGAHGKPFNISQWSTVPSSVNFFEKQFKIRRSADVCHKTKYSKQWLQVKLNQRDWFQAPTQLSI